MRIVVEGLAKSFGMNSLFTDLTFAAGPLGLTAVVGPSGSGKTTLLGILATLERADAGDVHVLDDAGMPTARRPELFGWVPQGANMLTARSALDNVMTAGFAVGETLSVARASAHAALAEVGLAEFAGAPVRQLSGGETQRVAMARAIASGRPILLADEPSANLDAGNTGLVGEALQRMARTRTVIVSTHDPALVAIADHVVELRPAP